MNDKGQLDSDKLPWLEPYREPAAPRLRLREVKPPAPASPAPRRRRRVFGSTAGATLGLLVATALALGGYWYGRQSATGKDGAANGIVTPLPPVGAERPVLTYPTIDDGGMAVEPAPSEAVADTRGPTEAEGGRPAVQRPQPEVAQTESAWAPQNPANGRAPAPPIAAPPPPKPRVAATASTPVTIPTPRPRTAAAPVKPIGKPGQNLLLGYYATPRYADQARSRVVARYPYLAGLPVQVAPVPLGPGRGSMYALRLVARSKSDARALCKNLMGIGYGCSVQ